MKAYCLGNSIILPHVRYIHHKEHNGSVHMMMFHSIVVKTNGEYKTLGCDNMDSSGFCLGHEISRKEFVTRYCGGIEPGTKRYKKQED